MSDKQTNSTSSNGNATPPVAPRQPEHSAVRQANKASDYMIYWLNVGLSVAILGLSLIFGFLAAIAAEMSGQIDAETGLSPVTAFMLNNTGIIFAGVFLLVIILVGIRMMRQMYLGNALQVEYSGYAWLRDWANEVAKDLHMPRVEVMVTQDPVMNAFAFGFMKPYTIVLNSGTVRWMSKDELKAVVVHEMAHIKYKHTIMGTYASILRAIPVLGILFSWMLDFWSRRSELTADRLALAYLRDKEQVKNSLICIHVGPDVASSFNDIAQQWQAYNTQGGFQRFTQTFSSHPFLVRRLAHIEQKYTEYSPQWRNTPEDANGSVT